MFFELDGEILSGNSKVLINMYPHDTDGNEPEKYRIEVEYTDQDFTFRYKSKKERDSEYKRVKELLLARSKRFSFDNMEDE